MNSWPLQNEPPPWHGAAVHVWRWPLSLKEPTLAKLRQFLSPDECQRAERFVFAHHGDAFVAGRGGLRTILGRYLRQPPQDLAFGYGPHGKPFLLEDGQPSPWHFNLAHSHELAVLAVTQGGQVGVDVEWIRPDCPGDTIAGQFFAPREIAALHAVAEGGRCEAFFTLWTRKEALIKATGKGLALPLAAFEVLPLAIATDIRLTVADAGGDTKCWSLRDLQPGGGYRGALAVEGAAREVWCAEFAWF